MRSTSSTPATPNRPERVVSQPPTVLGTIDRASFAAALAARLRAAGVPVGFSRTELFVRGITAVPPATRARLRAVARTTLVSDQRDLARFDEVFSAVFDDAVLALDPASRRNAGRVDSPDDDRLLPIRADGPDDVEAGGLPWATLPSVSASSGDEVTDLFLPERLPSELAAIADTPFDELDPRQLAVVGAWLDEALVAWPTRRSRRHRAARSGANVSLRDTLHRARRTGWEAIDLVSSRPVDKPRGLVLVCDVSQSMQPYVAVYLHLMRAAALTTPAEVFAFSTTLTRLTAVLSHRSPEVAVTRASEKVTDRYGGTRIATNLHRLLHSHHGSAVRGALVVIASDGWDSDPPEQLARVMAGLARRAHRLLWLNPRVAAEGFEPLVASMAAAWPHCDAVLPAHDLNALGDVVSELVRDPGSPDRRRRVAAPQSRRL